MPVISIDPIGNFNWHYGSFLIRTPWVMNVNILMIPIEWATLVSRQIDTFLLLMSWAVEQLLHYLDQAAHQWIFSSLRQFMSTINKKCREGFCLWVKACNAMHRHDFRDTSIIIDNPKYLMFQSTHLLEFNDVLDYCRTNKIQLGSQCPTKSSISQHQSVWQ